MERQKPVKRNPEEDPGDLHNDWVEQKQIEKDKQLSAYMEQKPKAKSKETKQIWDHMS